MTRKIKCRHCGQEIFHSWEWVHRDTASIYCDQSATKRAQP